MKSVLPQNLHPNRVFFTEFDRITYSQIAWSNDEVNAIYQSLERKVKLLTLTKGQIVIPASHLLESEIARDFIFAYPESLTKGLIVPSLRSEFSSCVEFLESKRSDPDPTESEHFKHPDAFEIAKQIDSSPSVVRWKLQDMSDWFKMRLLQDLDDEKSLLRLSAKHQGIIFPSDISKQIHDVENLSRGDVYKISKKSSNKYLWNLLSNYTDFIYYLSGAQTTDSEGVLPQENLLDFSIGDLAGQKTRLSESEVFFKIFIEIIKAKTSTYFPIDVLDAFSFHDTLDLHEIAISSLFTEKYNNIQEKTKEALAVHDPERLVLVMDELEKFEQDLKNEFDKAINLEMTVRQKEKTKTESRKLLHNLASLFIPYYGTPDTSTKILINGLQLVGKKDMAKKIERKYDQGIQSIERILERVHIADKQILIDFVDSIKKRYSEKLFDN